MSDRMDTANLKSSVKALRSYLAEIGSGSFLTLGEAEMYARNAVAMHDRAAGVTAPDTAPTGGANDG